VSFGFGIDVSSNILSPLPLAAINWHENNKAEMNIMNKMEKVLYFVFIIMPLSFAFHINNHAMI